MSENSRAIKFSAAVIYARKITICKVMKYTADHRRMSAKADTGTLIIQKEWTLK